MKLKKKEKKKKSNALGIEVVLGRLHYFKGAMAISLRKKEKRKKGKKAI